MPLNLPDKLPAIELLKEENIFVIDTSRADGPFGGSLLFIEHFSTFLRCGFVINCLTVCIPFDRKVDFYL